jgi:large repetitive protein
MRITSSFRLTAATVLTSVVATLAVAGPMAGTALAAAKPKAALPSVTATNSSTDSTPLGSRTASPTAHFSWSVISGETYTCFLDGASKTNCTTSADYSGIASGTHTFTLKVGKLTGFRPNTYVYTWLVDRTPPTSPPAVDPLPTPTSSNVANVTFSKVDQSTASFKCALDNSDPAVATDCSSPWPLSGLTEQSHTAYVYALDDLQNMNTTAGTVTWAVDHTAPNSPAVSVTPVGPTSSTDASITWVDGDAVTFTCALDNDAPVACTAPWPLSGLTEGTHVVAVTGTDGAGNVGTAGKVHWIVDQTPPATPIISTGPAATTDNTMATFQFGDADAGATFECELDSGAVTGSYTACTSPESYLGPLLDGNYLFSVRATDAAGNVGQPSTWAWTVDTTTATISPPQIQTGPAPLSHDTSPAFAFLSVDDPTATFLCAVDPAVPSDQSAYAACVSGDAFPVAVDGSHTLYVEEVSGSVTSLPSTWNWTLDSQPPAAPLFNAKPDAFSNATGASFNFSDTEANVSYVCQLDAQTAFACATPASVTQLSEGPHTFTVSATDAAGNTGPGSVASYSWTVDLTAPAKPTVTVADPSGTTATLSLSDSESGVTYLCALDGSVPAACDAAPSFSDLSGGPHTVLVQAIDQAGNLSLPQSKTWTVDPGAPNGPTFDSTPGQLINTHTADFAFSDAATSDPNTVVTNFECWLDGVKQPGCGTMDVSGVPSGTAALTGLPEGAHTFTVVGLNSLGNGTPASYLFTVDVTPPSISVTGLPASGALVNTTSVATTVSDSDTNSSNAYTCSLTGPNGFSSADCSGASGLADGAYTFTADTTDLAGNDATTYSRSWTVDATAPVLHLTGLPIEGDSVNGTSFAPVLSTTDAHPSDVYTCTLDGNTVPCDDLGNVGEGDHTFTADTKDGAGNDATTLTRHFTVDRTAPATPDVTGTSGIVNSTTASFAYTDTSTDASIYRCSLDSGTATLCPSSFPDLGEGVHTLAVTAADAAGNASAVRHVTWTVDTTAPVLHLTGLPVEGDSVNWASFTPVLSTTGAHPSNVYTCTLDGSPASCTNLGSVGEGNHIFTADTKDAAGNDATTLTRHFTVDRTAPAAPDVTGTSGIVNGTTASFVYTDTSTDASIYSCSLDSGSATLCPGSFPGLGDGVHTLDVTAADAAGNVSAVRHVTWTVDTGTPTGTVTVPRTLTGSAVVTWSEPVSGLDVSKVSLKETDSGRVIASRVTSTAGSLTVTPKTRLVPGQHYTVSIAGGAAKDAASNASSQVTANFRALRTLQENMAPITVAWKKVKARPAFGHSYVTEHARGAQSTWAFRGHSITWWTVKGANQGKALVLIDGKRKATVNDYAHGTSYRVARTFRRLGAGRHVITIRALGVKGAKAATGTFVSIDAFTVGKVRTSSPRVASTWRRLAGSAYYARHAIIADLGGEAISLRFRGTSITWTTVRNRIQGKAAVYVDGVRKATVDNYSARSLSKVRRVVRGLTDKVHTLRIVALGKHHRGAKGNRVTVDRFAIG